MKLKFWTLFLIGIFLILTPSVFAVAPTVTRDLPSSAAPGSSFTVTLTMDVDESDDIPPTCGLIENYPSGWIVSNISLSGTDDGDKIQWLLWAFGNPVQDQDITYQVTVPTDASGTVTSTGTVDIGSIDPYAIIGDSELLIMEYSVNVTRDLPVSTYSGLSFTVTLTMEVDESNLPGSVGVTENYPSGWTVSNISLSGTDNGDKIDWLFWALGNPVQDQDITYTLHVPQTVDGTYNLTGTVDWGGATNPDIGGDQSLEVIATCELVGDYPPCGEVTLSEVIDLANLWAQGQASLSDVIDLINIWSSG